MSIDILSWLVTSLLILVLVVLGVIAYHHLNQFYLKYFTNYDLYRGQTVLITGASSGIGLATAIELYKAGAYLILVGRDRVALQNVIDQQILPLGGPLARPPNPEVVECDMNIKSDQDVLPMLSEVGRLAPTGRINAVILCAGLSMREIATNMTTETEQYIMNVNYFAPTILARQLLQNDMIIPHGRIAVVSSLQGLLSIPFRSTYAASKHAVQAYFSSLRHELAVLKSTISVTIISPGYVATNLSRNALTGSGAKHNKLDDNTAKGLSPRTVALLSLSAILHRYSDIWLCPLHHQLLVHIQHWSSQLTSLILQKRGAKELLNMEKAN